MSRAEAQKEDVINHGCWPRRSTGSACFLLPSEFPEACEALASSRAVSPPLPLPTLSLVTASVRRVFLALVQPPRWLNRGGVIPHHPPLSKFWLARTQTLVSRCALLLLLLRRLSCLRMQRRPVGEFAYSGSWLFVCVVIALAPAWRILYCILVLRTSLRAGQSGITYGPRRDEIR